MILKIFAIHDRATQMFGNPMFLIAVGQAIRSFTDEVNRSDPQNGIYMHPDDFDLFELGTFDTSTAEFVIISPEQIAIGKNVKVRS